MILRVGMGQGERLDQGSSFRRVLTILPAGRQAEEDQSLTGLFRPLGMTVRQGTGAGRGWGACTCNSTLAGQDRWGFASLLTSPNGQGWLPVFPIQQQWLCPGSSPGTRVGFPCLVVGLAHQRWF